MTTRPIDAALSNAVAALHALRVMRTRRRVGPGRPAPWRDRSKYTGADMRRMARENGVGRPPAHRRAYQ